MDDMTQLVSVGECGVDDITQLVSVGDCGVDAIKSGNAVEFGEKIVGVEGGDSGEEV